MAFRVVIPARFASTRLPGKPLRDIAGKPMIQHVYERALESNADSVIIATDDQRIADAAQRFGADVCMTRDDHQSGTDRLAEVALLRKFDPAEIVVNVQGDEPLLDPLMIDQLSGFISEQSGLKIATLVGRIQDPLELTMSSIVKVVMGNSGEALYFSRQAIPFIRDVPLTGWLEKGKFYKHIGMYAYTSQALQAIEKLETHPLEEMEKLEQLTWLANGFSITCLETPFLTKGIDTDEDLRVVSAMINEAEENE